MTRSCWAGMARVLIVASIGACSEAVPPLSWHIRFLDDAASERATVVEAEIREGSCNGRVVFSSRGVGDGSAAAPGALPAGHYGFFARARDEECLWFAEACVERDLPSSAPIDLTLVTSSTADTEPRCESEPDSSGAFDAGMPDATGGDPEPTPSAATGDASTQTSARPDAATGKPDGDGSVQPRTSPDAGVGDEARCRTSDVATVACYDFANELRDSSGYANHASAQGASFEPLGSSRALRPLGLAVSVADAESLNVSAFTIEVWMRADALTNLSGDGDEFSLLLDKDRQYSVGIDALGSPVMTIYRDQDSFEHTTATDVALQISASYYLAYSYDGVTSRIYVDGREVDHERIELALSSGVSGPLFIGSGSPHGTRPFDGLIDALRISNVAREPAQICATAKKTLTANGCE